MQIIKNKQKGFTLIELLVVISIIGLLASVVLVSLNGVRLKARDAKRKADLKQLNTALNLYYSDNNAYPNCLVWGYSTYADWNTTSCLSVALKPYVSKLPVDPINNTPFPQTGGYSYGYITSPSLQDYDLIALLENKTDPSICQTKQWILHYFTPLGGGPPASPANVSLPWCGPLGAGYEYSNYMYADH